MDKQKLNESLIPKERDLKQIAYLAINSPEIIKKWEKFQDTWHGIIKNCMYCGKFGQQNI